MAQKRLQEKDVVIPYVQSGDGGEELKASIATLKNIGDWSGKVWVVGDSEPWFDDDPIVTYVPCASGINKWVGIQDALLKACDIQEVSEQFYYSNDDIYINDEFFSIPPMFRESIDEHVNTSDDGMYASTVYATKRLLRRTLPHGHEDIKNYETHTPLPVDKNKLGDALRTIQDIQNSGYMTLQLRTYYGNTENIGGEFYADGKGKTGLAITSS